MSVYNRPTRENFSLKTVDIPGAVSKKAIADRQLIYREKDMPQMAPLGAYAQRNGTLGREFSHIDPLELQEDIRHSR